MKGTRVLPNYLLKHRFSFPFSIPWLSKHVLSSQ